MVPILPIEFVYILQRLMIRPTKMLVKYADKVTPVTVEVQVQYVPRGTTSHISRGELAFRVLLRAATAERSETKNINTHQNNNRQLGSNYLLFCFPRMYIDARYGLS